MAFYADSSNNKESKKNNLVLLVSRRFASFRVVSRDLFRNTVADRQPRRGQLMITIDQDHG